MTPSINKRHSAKPVSTNVTMHIHGWGELEWSDVRTIIGSAMCAWADYQGFHFDTCPEETPPYSHLWAWNKDLSVLFRARINGDQAILSAIANKAAAFWQSDHEPIASREIEAIRYPGMPWGDDKKVRQPTPDPGGEIWLYETLQPAPVTFVGIAGSTSR